MTAMKEEVFHEAHVHCVQPHDVISTSDVVKVCVCACVRALVVIAGIVLCKLVPCTEYMYFATENQSQPINHLYCLHYKCMKSSVQKHNQDVVQ